MGLLTAGEISQIVSDITSSFRSDYSTAVLDEARVCVTDGMGKGTISDSSNS